METRPGTVCPHVQGCHCLSSCELAQPSSARPGLVHGLGKDEFNSAKALHKQRGHAQHYYWAISVIMMSRILLYKYM